MGFMRHGYSDDERANDEVCDTDNSHEMGCGTMKGHGVSDKWIRARLSSGVAKASPRRLRDVAHRSVNAFDRAAEKGANASGSRADGHARRMFQHDIIQTAAKRELRRRGH